jgi:hypothetical protein
MKRTRASNLRVGLDAAPASEYPVVESQTSLYESIFAKLPHKGGGESSAMRPSHTAFGAPLEAEYVKATALSLKCRSGPHARPQASSRLCLDKEHLPIIRPQPAISLKSIPFLNTTESNIFEVFRSKPIPELAGVRSTGFWQNVVLPALLFGACNSARLHCPCWRLWRFIEITNQIRTCRLPDRNTQCGDGVQ